MEDSRNILVISHEYPPIAGGGATGIRDWVLHLAARGNEVRVLTSAIAGRGPEDRQGRGWELKTVWCARRRRLNASGLELILFQVVSIPLLWREVRRKKPGLLLAQFGIPGGVSAALVSWVTGVPYVCLLGGHDVPGFSNERFPGLVNSRAYRSLLSWVYRGAVRVCPNSSGLSALLEASLPGLRVETIPYGMYCSSEPAPVTGEGPLQILHVGRLEERKRQSDLLQACAGLRERGIDFHCRIVGDGALQQKLLRETASLDLEAHIEFTGFVAVERLADLMREAEVFVLCSSAEGMPRAVVEAIGMGLPVIMTRVEGAVELVDHGGNGLLVDVGCPEQLTDALSRLADDPAELRAMASAARAKAASISWDSSCERLEAIYDRAVSCAPD